MQPSSEPNSADTPQTPRNSNYRRLPIIYRSMLLIALNVASAVLYVINGALVGLGTSSQIVYPILLLPASLVVAQIYLWLIDSSAQIRSSKTNEYVYYNKDRNRTVKRAILDFRWVRTIV